MTYSGLLQLEHGKETGPLYSGIESKLAKVLRQRSVNNNKMTAEGDNFLPYQWDIHTYVHMHLLGKI